MSATELMSDGALGIEDAQRFCGLGRTVLYALMTEGKLPYTKVGARRLIPKRALVALLSRNVAGKSAAELLQTAGA